MRIWKVSTLAFAALMLVALLAFLGLYFYRNTDEGSISDGDDAAIYGPTHDVFDNTFDDGFVRDMPEYIDGYKLTSITTPRTHACQSKTLFNFEAPQKTLEAYLKAPPDFDSVRAEINRLVGREIKYDIGFGIRPTVPTAEQIAAELSKWNRQHIEFGCSLWLGLGPRGDEFEKGYIERTTIYSRSNIFLHDYDDSWVAKIPDHIGGYIVEWIWTPKTTSCEDYATIFLSRRDGLTPRSTPPARINHADLEEEIYLEVEEEIYAEVEEEILKLVGREVEFSLSFYPPPTEGYQRYEALNNWNDIHYGSCGWGRVAAPAPEPRLSAGDDAPFHGPISVVFDHTFDDSWVAKMPERIGEYEITTIKTPSTYACSREVVISFRAPQETLEEYLANPPDIPAIRDQIIDIIGPDIDFELSFGRSELTVKELEQQISEWNIRRIRIGCA